MSTLTVNTEEDLAGWDGIQNIQIAQNITITSATASSFPLAYNSTSSTCTIDGGAFYMTINVGNTNEWKGLFYFNVPGTASNVLTIQYLFLSYGSGMLATLDSSLNSCSFLLNTKANTYNPYVNFNIVAIEASAVSSTTFSGLSFPGTSIGGFVGVLQAGSVYPASNSTSITFTNCYYSGNGLYYGSGYIAGSLPVTSLPNAVPVTISYTSCCYRCNNFFGTTTTIPSAGYFGNNSVAHDLTLNSCFVYTNTQNGQNNNCGITLDNWAFNMNNCYVNYRDAQGNTLNYYWLGGVPNTLSKSSTITNCWFCNLFQPTFGLTVYLCNGSATSICTLTNCAISNQTSNTNYVTLSNSVTNYIFNNPTDVAPFTSWSSSDWLYLNQSSPAQVPILNAFTVYPWNPVQYTNETSFPYYATLCICEGTFILTTEGYLPVEQITLNHSLLTVKGHSTKIKKIETRFAKDAGCVKIPTGFYSTNIPSQDVFLSDHHAIYLNEEGKYIHPFHAKEGTFQIKSGKEWGKELFYCIQTENYYQDILLASGLGIEGHIPLENLEHDWDCDTEKQVCTMHKRKKEEKD